MSDTLRAAEEIHYGEPPEGADWGLPRIVNHPQVKRSAAIIAKHIPAPGVNARLVEALKPFAEFHETLDGIGGGTIVSPEFKLQVFKDAKQALALAASSPAVPSFEKELAEALRIFTEGAIDVSHTAVIVREDLPWKLANARELIARYDAAQKPKPQT